MKQLFTIHAGEYLVASHIEKEFKNLNVWIPSKDTGIDLLVTNKTNSKTVSLQVKYSKDFSVTHVKEDLKTGLRSTGWWTFKADKIKKSAADYWILVLYNLFNENADYIIINPKELLIG